MLDNVGHKTDLSRFSRPRHWQRDSIWCHTLGIHLQHFDLISFWRLHVVYGRPWPSRSVQPQHFKSEAEAWRISKHCSDAWAHCTEERRSSAFRCKNGTGWRDRCWGQVDNHLTTISQQFNFCCNLPPSCWSASIAFASYCQFTTCPNLNSLSQTSIVCSIWFVSSFKTLQTALRLIDNYCVSHQPLFSLPCSCGDDPSAWLCFVNVTTQMHFLLHWFETYSSIVSFF